MTTHPTEGRLLTQTEVCVRLGICRKTLQVLRRTRKIGYVQFGHRTIRFRESVVEEFIRRRERAAEFYAESIGQETHP